MLVPARAQWLGSSTCTMVRSCTVDVGGGSGGGGGVCEFGGGGRELGVVVDD